MFSKISRQIDAGEGTESFASVSAADSELSRKSGRGAILPPPPPAGSGLNPFTDYVCVLAGLDKNQLDLGR